MADIQIPALGRPFDLGELYNQYSDTLLTGKFLWNPATLRSATSSPLESSTFEIFTEDNHQEKKDRKKRYTHLQIDNHSKLSILGGLIRVEKAAKYIHECKSLDNEVRVVLKFSHITHKVEMKKEKLNTVDFPNHLNSNTTHVVSSIIYGCDLFIVFKRPVIDGESFEDAQTQLKISALAIDSLLERSMSDSELSSPDTELITCTCFCDENLPFRLTNYVEVASHCKEIAQRVKQGKIPKLLTLHPPSTRSHRNLVEEVSTTITTKVECIMEQLHDLEVKCKQLQEKKICQTFTHLEKNMEDLVNQMKRFKSQFLSDLETLIPEARKTVTQQAQLNSILNLYEGSPFRFENVKKYIDHKNEEAKLLESYEEKLLKRQVKKIPNNDLKSFIRIKEHSYTFVFGFNVGQDEVPFEGMHQKYKSIKGIRLTDPSPAWEARIHNLNGIRRKIEVYLDFVEANKGRQLMVFGFTPTVPTDMNPAVAFYNKGSLTKLNTPVAPSVPSSTKLGSTSVDLTWSIPQPYSEQPTHYKVYYKQAATYIQKWTSIKTLNSDKAITIKKLHDNTEYKFAVCSVFSHYYSPVSPVLTVKTKESSYCIMS